MALFGRAAISELSLLSGVKRKLDLQPAKGGFWRKAAARGNVFGEGGRDGERELLFACGLWEKPV